VFAAHAPEAAHQFFELEALSRDSPSGPSCLDLCATLKTSHHAIVRLPPADAARITGMWRVARTFFALDPARKEAAGGGPFRRLPGVVGVAGYAQMEDGNEFLETRVGDSGELLPPPPLIDAEVPGFTASLAAGRGVLTELARTGGQRAVQFLRRSRSTHSRTHACTFAHTHAYACTHARTHSVTHARPHALTHSLTHAHKHAPFRPQSRLAPACV
jgi:hypothetical protein